MAHNDVWSDEDPREVLSECKQATIAICVDGCIFGGRVELKYGWYIHYHFNHLSKTGISADDAWPKGWRWIRVPSTERT